MFISPSACLFFTTLVGGVVLSVSSDSWFGAWCGLELNLMSFIPWISMKNNQYATEAALKYFLIQAMGSAFIILGSIMLTFSVKPLILLTTALLIKLGAAPFHFWFPQVMNGLSWIQCVMLMTLQKIAPLYLLSYTIMSMSSSTLVFCSGIISAAVGAIGGMNQVLLRKILAFSSINHISWMLFAMFLSETAWTVYFMIYSLVSTSVVVLFYSQQSFHLTQLMNFNKPNMSMITFLAMLSLGGLPPFTGFIPKWIIIQEMILQNMFFPLLILLLSALVTLYYYLRIMLMFLSLSSPKMKWNIKPLYSSQKVPFFMILNFTGLLFPSLFMLI